MKLTLSIFASLLIVSSALAGNNYYNQFQFKIDGDCSHIEKVWFHDLNAWDEISLGKDSEGRDQYAKLKLQLFSDNTYWLSYSETVITKPISAREWLGKTLFEVAKTGNWSISSDRLILSDVAVGLPLQIPFNGKNYDSIALQFSKALNDSRLLGKTIPMGYFGGNTGPKGVSINQYCGIKP